MQWNLQITLSYLRLFGKKKVSNFFSNLNLHGFFLSFFFFSLFFLIILGKISELKVDKQGVGGCGGLIRRTKGAVAIRITYKGIHMDFISCHLSGNWRASIFYVFSYFIFFFNILFSSIESWF